MKNRLLSLGIIGLLFLVGCGSRLTNENLSRIETGMTEAQVMEILGKPASSNTSGAFGLSATTYTYKSDKAEVSIYFGNGKVISKSGNFQ